MKQFSIWFSSIFLIFIVNVHSYADTVVVATNDWHPYNTSDGQGLVDQIVKEAFALVGHEVSYSVQPWARAYQSVKVGDADMTYPWGFSAERDAEVLFNPSPLLVNQSVFWFIKTLDFSWQDYDDLKQYSIGSIIGYQDTELLEENGIKVTKVQTEVQNLKLLLAGRIDTFTMNKVVGRQIVKENLTPEEQAQLTFYPEKPLVESIMYGVFTRNARGEQLVRDFEQGLKQLKEEGRFDEIMSQ